FAASFLCFTMQLYTSSNTCLLSVTDAIFGYAVIHCQFTASHDHFYLEQIFFNKVLLGQYNSTLGKYVGFTEKAQEVAEALNKNQAFIKEAVKNEATCKTHIPIMMDLLSKSVEPSVRLRSVEAVDSRHPGTLVCSAYNFYPQQIRLTWLRNGKEETSDVSYTDELPSGNWLYQIHSYLEFTPRPGEKITCMVEHASLMEPKLYDWEPTPESVTNKIAVGTSGLLLGLVFLVTGLIFYKKNTTGERQDNINQKTSTK
uniref:Ig-like domain-containing protein n=1 Tax=Dicentrarchus labrax TaxID=13489 RepID=A0A8C4I989_DICLA